MENSRKPKFDEFQRAVLDCLKAGIPATATVGIGFSGGMDSAVLLNVISSIRECIPHQIKAVHVNHGLSARAGEWEEFCREQARCAAIPFEAVKVDLTLYSGLGIEGAARRARYDAFGKLGLTDVFLGHHQNDQAETVLLQMLRGSGAKGASAMEQISSAGRNMQLLRPFLKFGRNELIRYAHTRHLNWIEDDSNSSDRFRRNFLRIHVLPLLETKFPSAIGSLGMSASNLADASGLLDDLADMDLAGIANGETLLVRRLVELGQRRARNAFRRWLEIAGVRQPSRHALAEALRQLSTGSTKHGFRIGCAGLDVRLFRGRLYLVPGTAKPVQAESPESWGISWNGEKVLALPQKNGLLKFRPATGSGIAERVLAGPPVLVTGRMGGERMSTRCGRPVHTLKKIFQEHAVPPWKREKMPLLRRGSELIAVPGLAIAAQWQAQAGEPGFEIDWVQSL